ncbi:MAG: bifunctional glycosyltransferase family 2/GtrA family protein [Propionibacteriales bacterium]|nr:bifunctional glycosyltransferase family 2/GtrA family protein [Propionibacteriales bacterium]
MSALMPAPATTPQALHTAVVDVIIPVYNEELDLSASVLRLDRFLAETFPYDYRVIIADNASTDSTFEIARRLADRHAHVRAVHLEAKGRGRALRQVWLDSDADVVAYMDVDLSTDLKALLPLVAPLVSGHSDVAIGTRLSRGSRVVRGPKREFISRTYNLILKASLGASFSDAQCGFKAIRREVADRLLPLVEDNNWFFDTELLVLAERAGLRIHEVPVDWVDDPGSTVNIVDTAVEDLKGVWRLLRGFATGRIPVARLRAELSRDEVPSSVPGVPTGMLSQMLRFAAVGVASTAAYFVLYLLLRPFGAQAANLAALLITAVANTAANRRFTFGISGTTGALKHHLGGLAAFGLALGLTSGSLWLLATYAPTAGRWVEVTVLVVANAAATLLRFLSLRLLMNRR